MSRVRRYSRSPCTRHEEPSATGLSPPAVTRSSGLRLIPRLKRARCRALPGPRPTPQWHRRQAVSPPRFGLLPLRSPLLRESSLFLGVLRCFSSPGAPASSLACPPMRRAGCPIRRSQDLRPPAPPLSISPRGRVLPRPPPPRHPPCAHHYGVPPGMFPGPSSAWRLDRRAPAGDEFPRSPACPRGPHHSIIWSRARPDPPPRAAPGRLPSLPDDTRAGPRDR